MAQYMLRHSRKERKSVTWGAAAPHVTLFLSFFSSLSCSIKRSSIAAFAQSCNGLFQTFLAAGSKAWQFANTLLLSRPPELFGCIDAQFFVQANSSTRTNMLNGHQIAYARWERLHKEVVINGHCASLNKLCDARA